MLHTTIACVCVSQFAGSHHQQLIDNVAGGKGHLFGANGGEKMMTMMRQSMNNTFIALFPMEWNVYCVCAWN